MGKESFAKAVAVCAVVAWSASATAAGSCNVFDEAEWAAKGAVVHESLDQCTLEPSRRQMRQCLTAELHQYSSTCRRCFKDAVVCAQDSCEGDCGLEFFSAPSALCIVCLDETNDCLANFEGCSGWELMDLAEETTSRPTSSTTSSMSRSPTNGPSSTGEEAEDQEEEEADSSIVAMAGGAAAGVGLVGATLFLLGRKRGKGRALTKTAAVGGAADDVDASGEDAIPVAMVSEVPEAMAALDQFSLDSRGVTPILATLVPIFHPPGMKQHRI